MSTEFTREKHRSALAVAEQFIPIEEVARLLGGVCLRTIRRLSDKGELCRPVKVGARSLYPKSEVVEYMERKKREREP